MGCFHGSGILKYVKGTLKFVEYCDILAQFAISSAHLLGYGDELFYQDDCVPAKIVMDWHTTNAPK
jgi:hypothetical protein